MRLPRARSTANKKANSERAGEEEKFQFKAGNYKTLIVQTSWGSCATLESSGINVRVKLYLY